LSYNNSFIGIILAWGNIAYVHDIHGPYSHRSLRLFLWNSLRLFGHLRSSKAYGPPSCFRSRARSRTGPCHFQRRL